MNDTVKGWMTQGGAWLTIAVGGITWDMWVAIIGVALSVFGLLLSHSHRSFERHMLAERNRREEELHRAQMSKLGARSVDYPTQPECPWPAGHPGEEEVLPCER